MRSNQLSYPAKRELRKVLPFLPFCECKVRAVFGNFKIFSRENSKKIPFACHFCNIYREKCENKAPNSRFFRWKAVFLH